ncbi:hypothetical protein ACVR1G_08985 [Streptococcus dentasini]
MIMKKLTYLTLTVAAATVLAVFLNLDKARTDATALVTNTQSSSQDTAASSTPSSDVTTVPLETTIVKASPGQYTIPEGTKVTVNENQTFKAAYDDGSTLTTYADNTYYYKSSEGAEARTYTDETYFLTTDTGISLTTYEDGSYQVNLTDGTTVDPSNSTDLASVQSQYNLPRIDTYNQMVQDVVEDVNQGT